jgi:hypothetical protein
MKQDKKRPNAKRLMAGRHDPVPGLPRGTKEAYLRRLQDLLGHQWLSPRTENASAIQLLWKRDDWLATSELLNFGRALWEIRRECPEAWLEDHAQRIRAGDLQAARGSVFEILSASMLGGKPQRIDFPPPNQPGHDLLLHLATGKRLRISCKVLSASDYQQPT